jgi:hypothetical protein
MSSSMRNSFLKLFVAATALLVALAPAQGQSAAPKLAIKEPVKASGCRPEAGKPYFVEFRARTAQSYGHSFLFHGKLAGGTKFASLAVAGLHPRGTDPAVYMQGHMMPVPAETGVSEGDLDEQYLTARYCVVLSEAEYNRVAAYIRRLQLTEKEWHAPTKNCNYFLGEVADYMKLKTPPTAFLYPESYVNMLRDLNESTGSIGAVMPSIPYGQFGMPQSNR